MSSFKSADNYPNMSYTLNLLVICSLFTQIILAVPPPTDQNTLKKSIGNSDKTIKLVRIKSSGKENNCLEVVLDTKDQFSLDIKLQKKTCVTDSELTNRNYQQFIIREDGTIQANLDLTESIIKKYRDQPQCLTIAHAKITELQQITLEDCAGRDEQKFTSQKASLSPAHYTKLCLGFDLLEEELALRDCAHYKNKLRIDE